MRRTRLTLLVAVVILCGAILALTTRLRRYDARPEVTVDWVGWIFAVLAATGGLALVGWWVIDRERRRRGEISK